MSFSSEHSIQITEAKGLELCRKNNYLGEGVHAITSAAGLHAIRFDPRMFSAKQARDWLSDHDHNGPPLKPASRGAKAFSETTFEAIALERFAPVSEITHNETGQPVQRFLKDIIKAGVYTHPFEGWTLDVTPERMDMWIAASRRMEENGVDAEVVVDHSFRAEDVRGGLTGLFREPDADGVMTLFGIHTMVGERGIELAKTVKNVSLWLDPSFTDGKGVFYGEAILHSAIVQQPVAPNQDGFIPIAASSGKTAMAASLRLSTTGESTMAFDITKWQELLGAGDEITEENLLEHVTNRLSTLVATATENDTEIAKIKGEHETLKSTVADLEAKAAGTKTPEPDKDAMEMLAEGLTSKVDALVDGGQVTAKAASIFKKEFLGEPGKRNARAMSRTMNGGATPSASTVLEILTENKLVDLKTATGVQALSRMTPDDNSTPTEPNKDIVANMVAGAGGKKPE
jgi:hypothetical protein